LHEQIPEQPTMPNGLRIVQHGLQKPPTAPADLPEPVTLGQTHLARTEPLPADWRAVREAQHAERVTDG
jgi:hypothetical protein